ncbi:hypothetical protein [Nocardia sp. NPDC020380]|uniref:hypothetical protein n=1 Tax=Nocardia sp. NPDC020380 TaxID=3364309 RepID=UPI0037A8A8BC
MVDAGEFAIVGASMNDKPGTLAGTGCLTEATISFAFQTRSNFLAALDAVIPLNV